MFLRTLYLHNFRCYPEAFFEFSPGINAIYGANARGKTTILEAIHVLITGRSFRTSQLADLIRLNTESFCIEASFVKHNIEQQLRISYNGKERKAYHNQTLYPSTSSLLGLLQGAVIAPDDAALIKGSPIVRRHFLDLQIAQTDPLYVHHLGRYTRAMRHRNALLRAKRQATIDSWEHEMATSATYLTSQRYRAICELETRGQPLHHALSGHFENLHLTYKTPAPFTEETSALRSYFLGQFQKHRDREMIFGSTLTGPHRDDLIISIDQKEVRFFASEGQQRSCVTTLRLAEWDRLQNLTDESPLMLVDDVGVSLDDSRKGKLLDHVRQLGQVFLTSAQELALECKLIRLS